MQPQTVPMPSESPRGHKLRLVLAILFLLGLSDFLMFDQTPGINLFLLVAAFSLAIVVFARRRLRGRQPACLFLLPICAAAPLLESPSFQATIIVISTLAFVALAASKMLPARWDDLPNVMGRFYFGIPGRLVGLFQRRRAVMPTPGIVKSLLRVWTIPLILSAGFLLLFSIANPLIASALGKIDLTFLLRFFDLSRIGLWVATGCVSYLLLRPRLMKRLRKIQDASIGVGRQRASLIGNEALLRALVLFNALFALETVLDLLYLWGGATLPDGMSYAEYAHRGAYPLVVTALLAAFFVLITMRKGGAGAANRLIRVLVYLWIGQNILLCLSSILRLSLYVRVYSLTELRLAAGIWMLLVAIGLLLIMLRIARGHSNGWLVATTLAMFSATTYLVSFADMPALVARFNVAHCREVSGDGLPLDTDYLLELGPAAIPAIDDYLAATVHSMPVPENRNLLVADRMNLADTFRNDQRQEDWRSWSFRDARLARYLNVKDAIP